MICFEVSMIQVRKDLDVSLKLKVSSLFFLVGGGGVWQPENVSSFLNTTIYASNTIDNQNKTKTIIK